MSLSPAVLHSLYAWIDALPLATPKKNIARDFSDATVAAQLVHIFEPKIVDLHNYTSTLSMAKKRDNWATFNHKVLKKLGTPVSNDEIESIIRGDKGAIERFLVQLQGVLLNQVEEKKRLLQKHEMSHSGKRSLSLGPDDISSGYTQADHIIQRVHLQEQTIVEQQQQIDLLHERIAKLEQLVSVKNNKIEFLTRRLDELS